ncbi:enoyl-CoA hydratase-related protein [Heliomarina baculiformis]|uniref:enoyl-CoA hydratase-related protein n=1 Tax=Heliomarina baculiformis TaxID=2872036 RepID=UPI001EE1936C|nr:enoyl-CoA hydratase-related protein [Heliomarina baculiformis]
MTNAVVLYSRENHAFRITLNRPEKRNAINNDLIEGISDGIKQAEADPDVRCIVLTGAGDKAFCAGGDLQPGGGFNFNFAEPSTAYGNLLRQAQNCPLPILAVVNGTCVAGGMGLVAMADLAIAVDTAKFGLPEAKIGLFPMQVLALMKALVPARTLREWMLTGELFSAQDAMEAGLLNRVVPTEQLVECADGIVSSLAKTSPSALRRGKYAMRVVDAMSFDQAIAFAEGQLGLMTLTQDAKEGLASFNEKRSPKFTGK